MGRLAEMLLCAAGCNVSDFDRMIWMIVALAGSGAALVAALLFFWGL